MTRFDINPLAATFARIVKIRAFLFKIVRNVIEISRIACKWKELPTFNDIYTNIVYFQDRAVMIPYFGLHSQGKENRKPLAILNIYYNFV